MVLLGEAKAVGVGHDVVGCLLHILKLTVRLQTRQGINLEVLSVLGGLIKLSVLLVVVYIYLRVDSFLRALLRKRHELLGFCLVYFMLFGP